MKSIRPLVLGLVAGATVLAVGAAQAQVNVGVTLGYPGGYGIAQPSYVAPRPVYVQPAPVYVQRGIGYGYPNWREREREHEWREHHDDRGYHDGRHDGDHRDHDRGEHQDGRDGWRR